MTEALRPALVVLLALLSACGGGSNRNFALNVGSVRVVNAVADSPALLVRFNDTALATVAFAQASGLSDVVVGTYRLSVQYTPPAGNTVTVLGNRNVTVEKDRQSTIMLLGTLAQTNSITIDEAAPDIAAGQSEVHFAHGASSVGSVDFYLTDALADIANAAPTRTVNAGAASTLATVPAANDYRLRVTVAGSKTVLYDSGTFVLEATARRLFVITDYFGPGGNGVRAIAVSNRGAALFANEALPAEFRVAHVVVDRPSVDVYAGGVPAPIFAALPEGTISGPELATPATFPIRLTPAGAPGTTVHATTMTLGPGQARTLVVAGVDGDDSVTDRAIPDLVRPIAGQAHLRIVQASPAAGSVDFHLIDAGATPTLASVDLANLTLQSAGEVFSVPGTFDAFFTVHGATTVVAGPVPVTLAERGLYTILLADLAGGGTPARVILADDFLE
jgi:hypothetical protein